MSVFYITFVILIAVSAVAVYLRSRKIPGESQGLVLAARVAAVICIGIALTMTVDLLLPKQIIEATVDKTDASKKITFGIYSENMRKTAYNELLNGEKVQLRVSVIYDEIKKIIRVEHENEALLFPTVDSVVYFFVMIVYFAPILIFLRETIKLPKNIEAFIRLTAIFLGTFGLLILGKLFLVHVFHITQVV